jgi:glycerol uptake facilitator-like aquaporin
MKRVFGEFFGTSILATVVVGSGVMGENLSKDVGVQLLINAAATGAALWLLITLFTPISGAHFNPVVTGIAFFRKEISIQGALQYFTAQVIGAVSGTLLANLLFEHPAIDISGKNRDGGNLFLSEILATAGLVFVIYQLSQIKDGAHIPFGVAAWIFAAYFFTSSTSFANPAITIGRIFSNTFAGIAPHSALAFIPFQILGGAIGYLVFKSLNKKAAVK